MSTTKSRHPAGPAEFESYWGLFLPMAPAAKQTKRERVHGMDRLQKRVHNMDIFGHVLETYPNHAHGISSKDRARSVNITELDMLCCVGLKGNYATACAVDLPDDHSAISGQGLETKERAG